MFLCGGGCCFGCNDDDNGDDDSNNIIINNNVFLFEILNIKFKDGNSNCNKIIWIIQTDDSLVCCLFGSLNLRLYSIIMITIQCGGRYIYLLVSCLRFDESLCRSILVDAAI